MTKVVRVYLIIEQKDKNGDIVEYTKINKLLWDLQKQTRAIKNKAIQYYWEYKNFSRDYCEKNGNYPSVEEILTYKTVDGYINNRLKIDNDLCAINRSSTIKHAIAEYKNAESDIKDGTRSIINYKSDQPLDLHNTSIHIEYIKEEYYLFANMVSREYAKANNFENARIGVKLMLQNNKSAQTIIDRCLNGDYKISESKIIYDRKKKQWCINLAYSFSPSNVQQLDYNKILGVDLGITYPLCASVYGEYNRLAIHKGEIENFRKKVEARRYSMLRQGKNCGDGRIGHGIKCRNKPAYNIEDKIARFRDTTNHKYSRALIEYAIKNNCGTIQMENLAGITDKAERFLKNWTYYDLQTKIQYKAKECGIKIQIINPQYTSQRCSRCGYIHSDNRKTQENFLCLKCGFEANADYNASQNISIKDIDKVIKKELENMRT